MNQETPPPPSSVATKPAAMCCHVKPPMVIIDNTDDVIKSNNNEFTSLDALNSDAATCTQCNGQVATKSTKQAPSTTALLAEARRRNNSGLGYPTLASPRSPHSPRSPRCSVAARRSRAVVGRFQIERTPVDALTLAGLMTCPYPWKLVSINSARPVSVHLVSPRYANAFGSSALVTEVNEHAKPLTWQSSTTCIEQVNSYGGRGETNSNSMLKQQNSLNLKASSHCDVQNSLITSICKNPINSLREGVVQKTSTRGQRDQKLSEYVSAWLASCAENFPINSEHNRQTIFEDLQRDNSLPTIENASARDIRRISQVIDDFFVESRKTKSGTSKDAMQCRRERTVSCSILRNIQRSIKPRIPIETIKQSNGIAADELLSYPTSSTLLLEKDNQICDLQSTTLFSENSDEVTLPLKHDTSHRLSRTLSTPIIPINKARTAANKSEANSEGFEAEETNRHPPKRAMSAGAHPNQRSLRKQALNNIPPVPSCYFNQHHSPSSTPSTTFNTPLVTPVTSNGFCQSGASTINKDSFLNYIPPVPQIPLHLPEKPMQKTSQALSLIDQENTLVTAQYPKKKMTTSVLTSTKNAASFGPGQQANDEAASNASRLIRRRSIHHQRHFNRRNTMGEACI
ncbi:hypothetical protein BDF19DRAFT_439903 [Syncephalis fuscata]|nr:hypothetical protein BDF19DRAFT_439903 [Syncephalis fuscata]